MQKPDGLRQQILLTQHKSIFLNNIPSMDVLIKYLTLICYDRWWTIVWGIDHLEKFILLSMQIDAVKCCRIQRWPWQNLLLFLATNYFPFKYSSLSLFWSVFCFKNLFLYVLGLATIFFVDITLLILLPSVFLSPIVTFLSFLISCIFYRFIDILL